MKAFIVEDLTKKVSQGVLVIAGDAIGFLSSNTVYDDMVTALIVRQYVHRDDEKRRERWM